MHRLALIVSHPIQYQAPWFRALANVTDLEVFFCHRQDGAGQAAAGFGVEFEWDVPLLDGYKHTWMENRSSRPGVSHFSGCDTPEVAARLQEGRFDACLVSGWFLKSYLQAVRACRRAGIPVLSRGDSHLGTPRSAALALAKYFPYRWLLARFDAHLFVGQANREYLAHYGVPESRLFFTPHFVDNDFFASRAAAARANGGAAAVRRQLGIPVNATVYAFVGKLLDNKRTADFIHAVSRLKGAVWGVVVGSGPRLSDLQRLAADLAAPVRFAGFRNQRELPTFLAASDALVLPSQSETWGLAVNEGMACGLPAIVSAGTGCAPDLIDPGQTGFVFPTGDIQALVDAFMALHRALAGHRSAVLTAVETRISRYSCDAAVRGTLDALDALVPARRTSRAGCSIDEYMPTTERSRW